MSESMYPQATKALAQKRSALAPGIEAAFRQFSQAVFQDGALPGKTKQLIAVAVAHVTQCPYCIRGHTKAARRHGATPEEIMEAVRVGPRCASARRGRTRRWPSRSSAWGPRRARPAPARDGVATPPRALAARPRRRPHGRGLGRGGPQRRAGGVQLAALPHARA